MTRTLLRTTALAVALGLAAPAAVFAQDPSSTPPNSPATPMTPSEPSAMPSEPVTPAPADPAPAASVTRQEAEQIIGANVVDPNGKVIGKIDDLVVARDGMVTHAVVSVGGVLGIGATDVMVPYDQMQPTPKDDELRVSMSEEQLKALPRYERDQTGGAGSLDEYRQRAGESVTAWQQRVDELNGEAVDSGKEIRADAKQALDSAWGDVKQAWSSLEAASADGWDGAKANFEAAMTRLDRAWTELTSEA